MLHLIWLLEYYSQNKLEDMYAIPQSSAGDILRFMQKRVHLLYF